MLDGSERSALAIVRSLGRRSVRVRVGAAKDRSLAATSRYCGNLVRYRDPYTEPAGFLDDVHSASPADSGEWIFPATDATTMLLVADPRFAGRLLAPPRAAYDELTDKSRLIGSAKLAEVVVPQTLIVRTIDEARQAAKQVGIPIVIKPSRSKFLHDGQLRATSVVIAQSPEQACRLLQSADWFPSIPALMQRYVAGVGAGVFALFWDGAPISCFSHRRLLERPPWGGVSVLSESAALEPALERPALRLLAHAGWSGLAMVEYRLAADGTPYLMEVNGRPWGSIQLAIDAGVDFPWLFYCCAEGLPFEPPDSYLYGRRLHWTLGNLDRLLLLLRDRSPENTAINRTRDVAAFLWTTLKYISRSEVLRASDPGPGFYEIRRWIADVLRPRV